MEQRVEGLSEATHLPYRADIDGLRAIAVLAVLVYHGFPQLLPGGFFGVDVFFVISGYLITGIIRREMLLQRFSLAGFYARRTRRILPALIVVVAATFAAGWFLLPPRDMQSLGSSIAGSAVFAQNFVLWHQIGYFDLAADRKPLLHLWSLGIEEQYYLVWPWILMLIQRWRLNGIAIVMTLAAASFALCLVLGATAPDAAFYLPSTRAWELLIGSVLALRGDARIVRSGPSRVSFRLMHDALALAALAAIAASFWFYRPGMMEPGWFSLLPVLGAAILVGSGGSIAHRHLLAARPAVAIGLISYPLYLWHFPLLAYARINILDGLHSGSVVLILMVSVVLAWLTYRLVEKPLRFGRAHPSLKVGGLVAGLLALGVIGLIADRTDGLPVRIPDSVRPFMHTAGESAPGWRSGKCLMLPDQSAADFAGECAGHGGRPLLLIWGDSYGASFYLGLAHLAAVRGFDVAQFTASACPPLTGYVNPERVFCKPINDYVLQRMAELHPDVVIMVSTWSYHVSPDALRNDLRRTAAQVKPLTNKLTMMGLFATWKGGGLPENLLDYYFESGGAILPERTWYRSNDNWSAAVEQILSPEAEALGIDYIPVRKLLCNDAGCLARVGPKGSELMTYDGGHLSEPGAIFLAGQVIDRLLAPKH